MSLWIKETAEVLGGRKVLGSDPEGPEWLISVVRKHLPIKALEYVVSELRLSPEELSHALGLSPRTLARRKQERVLSKEESERLVRLARVAAHARDALGDMEAAAGWLRTPSRVLGATPLSLLDTEFGAQMVDDELTRLEHGVYS